MTDSPGPVQLPTRTRIGRYQIQKLLGRGGMGEVYKAFDPSLDRVVALKTIVAGGNDESLRERLLREAQACGRLQHPGIVTVHDVGESDGVVFIAMEFLQGQNLADAVRSRALGAEQALGVLTQMLDALDYAHGEGVIHRDIKPGNVLWLPNGRVKILDFGIARIAKAEPLTMTGEVIGTPNYMSPEQMKAQPLDGRTDIYSTGIVGYELLTGRPAFSGETVTAVMLKVLGETAPPMETAVSLACPEVEQIIQRAIAKSPTDRYQHAREMADAIRELLMDHRDVILQASLGGQATIRTPSHGVARPETNAEATLRLGDQPTRPPLAPEATLRVTPTPVVSVPLTPPAAHAPATPLAPTIRQATTERISPAPSAPRSASKTGIKWPLAGAALVVIGVIIYVAPHLQPTNEVKAVPASQTSAPPPSTASPAPASPAPASSTSVSAPPSPAPASGTSAPAPVSPAPLSGTSVPAPPLGTPVSAPASGTPVSAPPSSTPVPAPPSSAPASSSGRAAGPLDGHAVMFAAGSEAAVTSTLVEALKDQGISRAANGARWLLTVHDQISVRPTGLGSSSALTADYTGDLTIQDRQAGTTDTRHFDGHALDFGEPVVRAAAARALAKQMADALATVLK